jgi:two-component system sensor histidine kinase CpxA
VLFVPPFRPRGGPWFAAPQVRAVFPVVLVLISGLVCLLLARYLTRPIAVFRLAGQRIAAGDLAARVGPGVGRRRDEFGALARDFDDMAGRVEQLVDSQQRLMRDVSHELRSPLARLQAAVGLLRQRGGDDANLERIEREIELLNDLIGRILGFSRLQGTTKLAAERCDVTDLVHGVVDDASFEVAESGIRFEFDGGGPEFAVADPALLRSAIDNVVRNAAQHARSRIAVSVARDGDTLRIVVADDGPGVPDADLERLFEPFFTTQTASVGAGVGLAIARRAIELHRGVITVCNGDAGGLIVTVELPSRSDD